jgi:hypothetical protein
VWYDETTGWNAEISPIHGVKRERIVAWMKCLTSTFIPVVCLLGLMSSALADVVVIANRSGQDVTITVTAVDGETRAGEFPIDSGDVVTIPSRGKIDGGFFNGQQQVQYRLDVNSAYYFGRWDDRLDLRQIGLGATVATQAGREVGAGHDLYEVASLPVKILADDDQRLTRVVWEPRFRKRLKTASDVLERYFRVRLQVIDVGTWDSDDEIRDFPTSLAEFETEVELGEARIAVGFTSQHKPPEGKTHLGGTRGPLHKHLLMREWDQHISEAERLELLLHELGHYFGAAHSPEPDSVMRPMLGDRKARLTSFRLGFDPVNALVAYLVTEEIRLNDVRSFAELSIPTKTRLRQIYAELARAQPDDPVATTYRDFLDQLLSPPSPHFLLIPGTQRENRSESD